MLFSFFYDELTTVPRDRKARTWHWKNFHRKFTYTFTRRNSPGPRKNTLLPEGGKTCSYLIWNAFLPPNTKPKHQTQHPGAPLFSRSPYACISPFPNRQLIGTRTIPSAASSSAQCNKAHQLLLTSIPVTFVFHFTSLTYLIL